MKRYMLVISGWIAFFLIFVATFQPCFAQVRQEQRLEGVSYREMAEWQMRYGGGISGCYPAPAPAFVPGVPQDVSNPCKPVRKKKRSGRK